MALTYDPTSQQWVEGMQAKPYASGTAATPEQIIGLYQEVFGRAPDTGGLNFYGASGWSPDQIRTQLLKSPEYSGMQARKYATGTPATQTQLGQAYQTALGRRPDKEGSQFYGSSNYSYDQVLADLMKSKEATQPQPTQTPTAAQQFPQISQSYQPYQGGNPYLVDQAKALTELSNQNLMQTVLPQVNQNAMSTGGFGGARNQLAQGTAIGNAQTGLNSAISNLYSQGYNTDQALANQYNIANGNLGLGYAGLDLAINNSNVNNQLAGANLGLNAYNTLLNSNMTGLGTAQQMYQQPANTLSGLSQTASGLARGYGTTQQTATGNPYLGALGGAVLGSQLYKSLGV